MPVLKKYVCTTPGCKNILIIQYKPEYSGKGNFMLTCPNCKVKKNINEFKEYVDDTDTTISLKDKRFEIGKLRLPGVAEAIPLNVGVNIIGRKANASKATLQVEDASRLMSRSHFYINVLESDKGTFHTFYLVPGIKNATFLNDQQVYPEDKYFLNDGDRIRIGNLEITFVK